MMIYETLPVGPLQCNCVILGCGRTKEAVIIDPGDEAERIIEAVSRHGLNVKYLLHTHAHFDHIAATGKVKAVLDAPPCLHKEDDILFRNLPLQGQLFGMQFEQAPLIEKFIEDSERLSFGDHTLEVLHTPGHSPGSICFRLLGESEMVFSGDTLFNQSIGRADLWGGDGELLIRSIKRRLLTLDDDLPVHPGHGPSTTIGIEKRQNPFLT